MPYIANPLEGIPLVNTFITDQDALGTTPATDDKLIIYDESSTALKRLTISELQASLLVSPAFTGTPTAPTANAGTSTTQVATTAFVTIATTALNTIDEMTDTTISSVGANEVLKWNGSAWINQTLTEANILTESNPTFTGTLTVGSATIVEADLELIDGLTAGTVVLSKAVTVDSNKDVGTIRNLTIDGVFTDGNYTFATDGNVSGLGTVGCGVITATGTSVFSGLDVNGAVDISGTLTMSGGTLDMSDEAIDNIKSATFIAEVDNGTQSSGTHNITWANGQKQKITASGNIALDFVSTSLGGPCNLILKLIHSGGGRTITWNDSPDIKWPGGTAPTLSTSAGTDIIAFYYDGTTYYGNVSVGFA